MTMERNDRMETFKTQRDQLNNEFLQGLLSPLTYELLMAALVNQFCALTAQEHKEEQ